MNFRLKVEPKGYSENNSDRRLFSFAVVDLDRSKSCPQNFVCMLPLHIEAKGKVENIFQRVFGDKSVEQAKALLIKAIKSEDDSDIKAEIARRLKMLEPKNPFQVKCTNCGKTFKSDWVRRFRWKFCPECMRKKCGNRNKQDS